MSAEGSRRPVSRLLLAAVVCLVLGAAGGVLAAVLTSQDEPERASFTPPREPPPTFRLRDQDGKWVTPRDGRGKVQVMTFVYATCRDLCPAQLAKVSEAVGEVGAGNVKVVAVSVDPIGDTPARAKAYLERFQLAGPGSYLIGSRRELAPVWSAYGIVPVAATDAEIQAAAAGYDAYRNERYAEFEEEYGDEAYTLEEQAEYEGGAPQPTTDGASPKAAEDPFPAAEDFRYRGRRRHYALDFEHSAYVLLIDKQGRQRVGFPFEQLDAKLLAGDIRALQAER